MKLLRRLVLLSAAVAVATGAAPHCAQAQSYPARPVRLVVGFPAGGPNDIIGRLAAGWLTQHLGQPFVVDNKPGNSGNIATAEVVRSPADGYTLLLVGPANAISASISQGLGFDFLRDIAPVAALTREALVLVTHPSAPARSVPELVAHVRASPGMVRMASTGVGSSPHVTGELFKRMTGLTIEVVHYAGGGPALKAMIAGEAGFMFEPMSASIEPVKAGRLRALAVSTATRAAALPHLPVVAESVPGFEASAVTGLGAPRSTPVAIVDTLNRAINAAFAEPVMAAHFADTGGAMLPGSSAAFAAILAEETAKWAKVLGGSSAATK